ncbi:MAG: hypothetical protein ACLFWL_18825 [Candidatus Brocadiia bacterium]
MNRAVSIVIAFVLAGLFCGSLAARESYVGASVVELKGKAEGGTLILYCPAHGKTPKYVSIETKKGQTAESVAQELAKTISEKDPFDWWGHLPKKEKVKYRAKGSRLVFSEAYVLAGTEQGLGIPPPPVSLSCTFRQGRFSLHWKNPSGEFDEVTTAMHFPFVGYGGRPAGKGFKGTKDTMRLNLARHAHRPDNADFRVIAWRGVTRGREGHLAYSGGTPSNAAAIHLDSPEYQDELYAIPFSGGIAPNWSPWVQGGAVGDHLELRQGTRKECLKQLPKGNRLRRPDQKPFYQLIRIKSSEATGGIYRQFLGLEPGKPYRVSVLLNTLAVEKIEEDWSLSFHAAVDGKDGKPLNAAQMSGEKALPDGHSGSGAGRIVRYGPEHTTEGKWVMSSSSPDAKNHGQEIGDLVLPEGRESITVWVRHQAEKAKGVGYLYVKLEDLSWR